MKIQQNNFNEKMYTIKATSTARSIEDETEMKEKNENIKKRKINLKLFHNKKFY